MIGIDSIIFELLGIPRCLAKEPFGPEPSSGGQWINVVRAWYEQQSFNFICSVQQCEMILLTGLCSRGHCGRKLAVAACQTYGENSVTCIWNNGLEHLLKGRFERLVLGSGQPDSGFLKFLLCFFII